MKKILLIGSAIDSHLVRLIRSVKQFDVDNCINFDILDVWGSTVCSSSYVGKLYNKKKHFGPICYKIPILSRFVNYYDNKKTIKELASDYDLINIHYITPFTIHVWSDLRKKSKRILISPWGSDLYRIDENVKKKYKVFFTKVPLLSCPQGRFRTYIQDNFAIPQSKLLDLGFGSETIDSIMAYSREKETAKEEMGYPGKFVITCGYNRVPAQNHIKIIQSIIAVKEYLPKNLLLVFPFTYGNASDNYKKSLIGLLSKNKFDYCFIESYLTNDKNACLRYSTDIFIHFQDTDAASASIIEHILAGSIVLNADWLRYPELEQFGECPYICFSDENDLSNKLKDVVLKNTKVIVNNKCMEYIKKKSWHEVGRQWFQFYKSLES